MVLVSRERFIEIISELSAVEAKLKPLLDRKAALEAERDALWPPALPAPAQLTGEHDLAAEVSSAASKASRAFEELRKRHVQETIAREVVANAMAQHRGAIRSDGPTARRHVLAFMMKRPGEWLKARQVAVGMGLDPLISQAVRASLERLIASGSVEKNDDGEYRLVPSAAYKEAEEGDDAAELTP